MANTFNGVLSILMAAVQLEASSERWATLLLFRGVENASEIRTDVTQGSIKACVLDPAVVSQSLVKLKYIVL